MKHVLVACLLVACGGKPAPATPSPVATGPTEPAPMPVPEPAPEPVTAAAPTPEPAPVATPAVPLEQRLRDDGPVPGVPGYVQKRTKDAKHCSGEKVVVSN